MVLAHAFMFDIEMACRVVASLDRERTPIGVCSAISSAHRDVLKCAKHDVAVKLGRKGMREERGCQ